MTGGAPIHPERNDQKIDPVASMMDAYIAYKENRAAFD